MKKALVFLLIILTCALVGCVDRDSIKVTSSDSRLELVSITDKNDRPEFRREYTTTVTARGETFTVVVEGRCLWWSGRCDRSYYGSLTQPNDRYVGFEPEKPADKIIDRDLIGPVEYVCQRILAADTEYWSTPPNSYTDKSGTTWARLP